MGPRGDAIAQMDWSTGEVLKELRKLGLEDNTLLVFTSDNGPVLDDGYEDKAEQLVGNHRPGGPFKGGKYSAYEAGTRVPTIVYWPSQVKPGISRALVSQVDLYASFAALVNHALLANEAPDSFNTLEAFTGKSEMGRESLLEESFTFSLRQGYFKYILPQTTATPNWLVNKHIATGLSKEGQLYDLKNDVSERDNLLKQHPAVGQQLQTRLKAMMKTKGTRPSFSN